MTTDDDTKTCWTCTNRINEECGFGMWEGREVYPDTETCGFYEEAEE